MQQDKKERKCEVPLHELTPLLNEVLAAGGSVELTATGNSMRPMLYDGNSRVRLTFAGSLKRGDIPLYRRENGAHVLHRVITVETDGTYTCCGDAQWHCEQGIRPEQVLGVVTHFTWRKNWVACDHITHVIYWRIWVLIRPIRRLLFGGIRRIRHYWNR